MEDSECLSALSVPVDQFFVATSGEALSGKEGPRTMRLQGQIQGKPMLILLDSGNTFTFISQKFSLFLQSDCQVTTDVHV
jgi:hypothetical protein